jgi:hypothetical protein
LRDFERLSQSAKPIELEPRERKMLALSVNRRSHHAMPHGLSVRDAFWAPLDRWTGELLR